MWLFIVSTGLLTGLVQGVPYAEQGAITAPKPEEKSLVARWVNVTSYLAHRQLSICIEDIAYFVFRLSSTTKQHLLHILEGGNNGGHKFHLSRQQNFEIVHDGKKHVQISTISVLAPLKLFFSHSWGCVCASSWGQGWLLQSVRHPHPYSKGEADEHQTSWGYQGTSNDKETLIVETVINPFLNKQGGCTSGTWNSRRHIRIARCWHHRIWIKWVSGRWIGVGHDEDWHTRDHFRHAWDCHH